MCGKKSSPEANSCGLTAQKGTDPATLRRKYFSRLFSFQPNNKNKWHAYSKQLFYKISAKNMKSNLLIFFYIITSERIINYLLLIRELRCRPAAAAPWLINIECNVLGGGGTRVIAINFSSKKVIFSPPFCSVTVRLPASSPCLHTSAVNRS